MTGRILAFLAVLALLLVLPTAGRTALAQQQPPHRFGGTATLDGKAVAAGVKVSAVIDEKEVATATTITGGNYIIDVIQPPGASYAGKTVTFNIGTGKAAQRAAWTLGGATVLNLAAVSETPPPTPQSTPTPAPVTTPPGPKQGLFGVVTAVTKDIITIKKNEETVTLKVDAKTQVSVPGIATAEVTDISVGSRVAVLAERRGAELYSIKIHAVLANANEKHITLTVLEVSGKTLIGVTSGGEQIVVELDFELSGELKGRLITFIGEQPESNRFKAKAAMKLENVISRLDKHVKEQKLEARGERDVRAKAQKEQRVEALKARLEANLEEHLDRFAEVIAKAPEQARPALERALQNFKRETSAALGSIDRSPQDVQKVVERRTLKGTVESVNATAGELVVRSKGDAVVKVKVVAATQIRIGEARGGIGDIRAGDPVEVRFNHQTSEAASIHVKLEVEAKGKIKIIDATAKTMVLELPGNATLTLKLTERTKIEINNRSAAVANLSVGMIVAVTYNSRTLELVSIAGELRAHFELTVDRLDTQARTIVGHTDDGKSVTVKVTDRTHVEARGGLSSIFGLQTGTRIEVEINPLTGEALYLKIIINEERVREEAKAKGRLPWVDVENKGRARGQIINIGIPTNRLTVRLPNRSEITVTITNATKLEVDGEDATLADLKEGYLVKLEYNPETLVALEVEAITQDKKQPRPELGRSGRARVEGAITAVDPAKGTLTIFTKNGETRVITIRSDTAMAFNEKRITALSELPSASAVTIEVTEGNVAIKIEAKKKEEDARHRPPTQLLKEEDARKDSEARQKEEDTRKTSEARQKEEDARKAAEAKQKQEDDRKAAEAKQKQEDDRKAAEAKQKQEDDRKAAEAKQKQEDDRKAAEAKQKQEDDSKAAETKKKQEDDSKAAETKKKEESAAEAKRKEEAAAAEAGTKK